MEIKNTKIIVILEVVDGSADIIYVPSHITEISLDVTLRNQSHLFHRYLRRRTSSYLLEKEENWKDLMNFQEKNK